MKTWLGKLGNHINLFCEQFWSRNCDFILHKASRIEYYWFLQESLAVAREDALEAI